ncbi:hypothetical protein DA792_21410 (plasmid) [Celeribacter baekdonensis]|uniref:Uncharacterized protein n=1 Tax=Celeribacter baekdonensis TaxID=875171 RepID=A0A2R4M8R9_9RHOB|nr:hypothetical protein DA792_21410 [Celeribacter baekdonensis]
MILRDLDLSRSCPIFVAITSLTYLDHIQEPGDRHGFLYAEKAVLIESFILLRGLFESDANF